VSNPISETTSFNQVYSMISSHKYLCEITTGETEWGVGGEGEGEKESSGLYYERITIVIDAPSVISK
jgi:hypothetical protein